MKRKQKNFLRRERNKSHHDLISKNVLHAFQVSHAFHALHDFYAPHTLHTAYIVGQIYNLMNRVGIPTGRKQTSCLCTSTGKELNQGLLGTNPRGGQCGT